MEATPTRAHIYSYGAKAPYFNAELVAEQIRAAHRYRNTAACRVLPCRLPRFGTTV